MWSEVYRKTLLGDNGAGSTRAAGAGSAFAIALGFRLTSGSGAGVGGGVAGSSMILVRGFLGAASLAPGGRPRFLGAGALSGAGGSLSGISSTFSICLGIVAAVA